MRRRVSLGLELRLLRQQLHQALELAYPPPAGRGFTPLVDVGLNEEEVLVWVDLPGVDPKSLQVQLVGAELRIAGEKPAPAGELRNYHQVERAYGPFLLEITLPEPVQPHGARAQLVAGVLEVRLRRQESTPPQPLPIPVETEEP